MNEVEISQIDRRFEGYRLKDKNQEKILLTSISEQGIREPLQCVVNKNKPMVLLDGFKRLRCCIRLGLNAAPVVSLGEDEAGGILQLIRQANAKNLNVLEQSRLVDELKEVHGMSAVEISRRIEKSPAWVSVRLGIMAEMSEEVQEALFSGKFPVRSYMYTIRHFTRVNKVPQKEIEQFIKSVSGKGASAREIETLAYGYFHGGKQMKEQIEKGRLDWTLSQLKRRESDLHTEGLDERGKRAVRDFELAQKYIGKVIYRIHDKRQRTPLFFSAVHLLTEGLLGKMEYFRKTLETFYDECGQKKNDTSAV